MSESHNSRSVKSKRWVIVGGLLAVLTLAVVVSLVYFNQLPQPVIRFIYSITQYINIGDAGVLSDKPCASPCVFGIQVGKTQFDQVPPLLEKNDISKCFTEPSVSWVLISCGMGRFNIQADAHTQIVNGIWFYPNDSISLGEIIEKYGDPDFASLDYEEYLDPPTIQIRLYWDSFRMTVILPKLESNMYPVEKATIIEGVDFADDNLYQSSSEVELVLFYRPWNGYSTYQPYRHL